MSSEHSRLREWADLVGEDIVEDANDDERSRGSTRSRDRRLERSS